MNTGSYSKKLLEHTRYYRTYANVLEVRVVEPEYLIAMKLRSAREYKRDLSDVIGIIMDENSDGKFIDREAIMDAYADLYGEVELKTAAKRVLEQAYSGRNLQTTYYEILTEENRTAHYLHNFESQYKGVLSESNIDTIISRFKSGHIISGDRVEDGKEHYMPGRRRRSMQEWKEVIAERQRKREEGLSQSEPQEENNRDLSI